MSDYDCEESSSPSQTTRDANVTIRRNHHTPSSRPTQSSGQLVPIEFGRNVAGTDPFDNREYEDRFGELRQQRKELLDQITSTAEHLFAIQHRVALFMVLIIGRRFRLIRWDHSGTIVTPSIDYFEHPEILCDAFWRIAHLDDSALGFDPSATELSPGDADYLRMEIAALKESTDANHDERRLEGDEMTGPVVFEYVRTAFRDSLRAGWPRYKLEVPDGMTVRHFLVGKPTHRTTGLFGRGTRGYVAYDCKTGRFVWLKDTWRASYIFSHAEGEFLAMLNEAHVVNVPTLVCHGDIHDQTTITSDWWERTTVTDLSCFSSSTLAGSTSPSSKKRKRADSDTGDVSTVLNSPWVSNAAAGSDCPLRQHKHYRIVVEEVCMPLKCFKYGQQLVSLVLDCLHGTRSPFDANTQADPYYRSPP